jgi:hypothetical protein
MSISPAVLLFALGAPLLLGCTALRAIGLRCRDDRLGYFAWAWLAGCFVLALLLYGCLQLHIEPAFWWSAPVFGGLALALVAFRRGNRREPEPVAAPSPRGGALFLAVAAAGSVLIGVHALAGASRPCLEADEGNIWSLKAKSLLFDWAQPEVFASAQRLNLHPDYPLQNPLLQAWVSALHGDVVHFENRFLIQLCALALWLAFCAALRVRIGGVLASLLAMLLLLCDDLRSQCRLAYADAMVAAGLVVAFDAFLRWRSTGRSAWKWLAALGLALALWSKNEAVMYALAAAAAAGLTRPFVRPLVGGLRPRNLIALALPVGVVALQLEFNRRFGLQSDLMGANPTGKSMFVLLQEQWGERLPVVLGRMVETVLSLRLAQGAFLCLLVLPVLLPRVAWGRELALPTLGLLLAFVGVHVVYLGSFLPLQFHLDTSYERVLFQLLPAVLVWFAAVVRAALGDDEPVAMRCTGPSGPASAV